MSAHAHMPLWKELYNKSIWYFHKGEYSQATKVSEKALQVAEKTFGANHLNVASTLILMGSIYHEQHKCELAMPLLKRAIGIHEKEFGKNHLYVKMGIGNLADLYKARGKLAEVVSLYTQAFEPDDPYLGKCLNEVAGLYYSQESYEDAEGIYKRVLIIWQKALGTSHPDIASTLKYITNCSRAMEKNETNKLGGQDKKIRSSK
jgi:tetratricopeptide (TPR) repeat protein